jgi:hypothetical protein
VRSAIRAERSVGNASASSNPFVCSDWVPPQTAANPCSATRMMLTSGCWAWRVTPPVWVWKRILVERSSVASKRSRMIFAHIRRTARNFATSWKTLLWQLKKNASRGPNSSTFSPAASAASTYAIALDSVNATSCTAEQPFSRMW